METADICIVGAGMAGASIAYHVAPQARVLLLEREPHVAFHSSGRSAAMYTPQYGSLVIRRLTAGSGPFVREPPAGFAATPLLTARGFLTIGAADERALLALHVSRAAATGATLEPLTGAEARALVPALRPGAADWALYDRDAMDLDVEALLQGFLRGARSQGARVVTSGEVLEIKADDGRWRVRTAEFEVRADVVVNAAGAWADELATRAGIAPLGLVPQRRTAFVFDAPAGVDCVHWPMVSDVEERFYFKPDAGRLLGSLAEEVPSAPCDAQPDDLDVATAVDRIEQAVDFSIRRVVRSWTGLRTFAVDRDPVSGFEPGTGGFYWHAALGGYGIQTAAALGEFAAAQILGRDLPAALVARGLDAAQLSPARLRGGILLR